MIFAMLTLCIAIYLATTKASYLKRMLGAVSTFGKGVP